jgi:hypothetical protein
MRQLMARTGLVRSRQTEPRVTAEGTSCVVAFGGVAGEAVAGTGHFGKDGNLRGKAIFAGFGSDGSFIGISPQ